jgi:hypothetical protein
LKFIPVCCSYTASAFAGVWADCDVVYVPVETLLLYTNIL